MRTVDPGRLRSAILGGAGDPGELSDLQMLQLWWYDLRIRLPPTAERASAGTETQCRRRLLETRWPHGFACPVCGSKDAIHLDNVERFKCRQCGRQTSVTAGTALGKSTTMIALWFATAERCVLGSVPVSDHGRVTARELERYLCVTYKTAWRMRDACFLDLSPGGAGLLRDCVCTHDPRMPEDVTRWTEAHLVWTLQAWIAAGQEERGTLDE